MDNTRVAKNVLESDFVVAKKMGKTIMNEVQ